MTRDPEKRKAAHRRHREKRKLAKYGPSAAGRNMSGRHGNHARGPRCGRWNAAERRQTSNGYVAVRVPVDHPHAWGPVRLKYFKYAYEHIVVMMATIGRPLADDETVHHRNGDKTDNRPENLELLTRTEHAKHHDADRGRDAFGRFPPEDLRVRQWPEVVSR